MKNNTAWRGVIII